MFQPATPGYRVEEFEAAPLSERLRMVCASWAEQGYGSPPGVYLFYLVKLGLFVGAWAGFMSFTEGVAGFTDIGEWWLTGQAFQKAVVWSVAFEGLGLASGSGPLTGRYVPPFGGFLYFLRPGTVKLPLFPGLPVLGRPTRSAVDVVVYAVHYVFLARILVAGEVTPTLLIPTLILLPLLGVADKTAFLAARPDHYYAVLVAFAFADWLPATKLIWVAVWFWAATSKLNRHFPGVVAVMVSNSPTTVVGPFRRWMYRHVPDDLRPSALARVMAHGGTALEYAFPLTLLISQGGVVTNMALTAMLAFHLFITTSIPMGVPIEWNVTMVYGGLFLFGENASVRVGDIDSPLLVAYLVFALVAVPLIGNLVPSRVSFLMSMRYYAGNWPFSIWLFENDSIDRLDRHLVKSSKVITRQLAPLYDDRTIRSLLPKIMAFRAMHLHGRALAELVPRAVDDVRHYEWMDGELVAGQVVGWNFGDGHLHHEQLLRTIQSRCGYAPGELRVVMVESQPMGRPAMAWRIHDASTGLIESGLMAVAPLTQRQPWEPSTET